MASYIIKNQIDSLNELKNFNGLGYSFNVEKSNKHDLVFCR